MSHELFCFLNSDSTAFQSKKSSLREQDQVLGDTFFLIDLTFQCLEVFENSYLKKEKFHMEGGQKNII